MNLNILGIRILKLEEKKWIHYKLTKLVENNLCETASSKRMTSENSRDAAHNPNILPVMVPMNRRASDGSYTFCISQHVILFSLNKITAAAVKEIESERNMRSILYYQPSNPISNSAGVYSDVFQNCPYFFVKLAK